MCGFINGEGSFVINPKGNLIFYIEQAESEVLNLIKKVILRITIMTLRVI